MGRKRKQFPLYEEPDAKLARADSEGDLSENDDGAGDLRSGDEEFRGEDEFCDSRKQRGRHHPVSFAAFLCLTCTHCQAPWHGGGVAAVQWVYIVGTTPKALLQSLGQDLLERVHLPQWIQI